MENREISIQRQDAVYRIELNRPECGNLVTTDMIAAIGEAVRNVPPDAKLVVIAGRGADFCKGRDYQVAPESARDGRTPSARAILDQTATPVIAAYTAIRDAPIPTLAIVQGAAHGFGCALAGACDIVLAAETSRFRFPEMNRGLPPTLAMHAVMDRITPRALAYLVYSTAEVDARTALTMGLASVVYPDGDLERQAGAFAAAACAHPLDAVRAVKAFLRHAPLMEPRGRADLAANLFANVLSSR